MGEKTKIVSMFLLLFVVGCNQGPIGPAPSPAIIVTTWETDNGPGAKIVYENHYQEYLGNNQHGNPQVTFRNADQVASYTKQMQRTLDELAQIEDRMRQLEGQDVQEPTDP